MVKLEFYVPQEYADRVKNALFDAGAGKIGNYDKCSWETSGTGQFRPGAASNPAVGEKGSLTKVEELKIEMVCREKYIDNVINALKEAHPYETPAYHYWSVKY
jgi:hypothetical protein